MLTFKESSNGFIIVIFSLSSDTLEDDLLK